MAKKIEILLIDDDDAANFINQVILEKTFPTGVIRAVPGGPEALDLLDGTYVPDVILLDINMPLMNGWSFLEAFEKLPSEAITGTRVIILTTSIDSREKVKASQHPKVVGFLMKPMEEKNIKKITKLLE